MTNNLYFAVDDKAFDIYEHISQTDSRFCIWKISNTAAAYERIHFRRPGGFRIFLTIRICFKQACDILKPVLGRYGYFTFHKRGKTQKMKSLTGGWNC